MKVANRKKDRRFVITMLAVSAVCCILTNMSYNSGVSNFAASALGTVVTPFQKLAANVRKSISEFGDYFGDVKALEDENESLKKQVTELSRENSELAPLKSENEMLYRFLGLKTERTDLELVNAEIISRSVSNYTSDFTVDKGSVHGIEKNMAVMTEDGSLLGIIFEVGATYARGKVLTSYDFGVGIKNERTGEPGVLSGSFELSREGLCMVPDLYDYTDYAVGDIIRTSSLGEIYPPGLYVGTVREIVPDKLGYTLSAIVEPSASINETDMVMIITDFDRDYVQLPEADVPFVYQPAQSAASETPSQPEVTPDTAVLPAVPNASQASTGELPAVPDAITNTVHPGTVNNAPDGTDTTGTSALDSSENSDRTVNVPANSDGTVAANGTYPTEDPITDVHTAA